MKRRILASRQLSEGIFWDIDGELLAYPFGSVETCGVSKSGTTYNHKRLWEDLKPKGSKVPYNYYPRGRVVLDNKQRPVIYMNPNVSESLLSDIRTEFGIRGEVRIQYDYSDHYKCYLDE